MPKARIEDFDRIIEIDADALDREWLGQPRLVWRFSEDLAQARYEHAKAEARLDLVESELYLQIRANPAEFGLGEKPTEATVKAAQIVHERYQSALKEVNNLKLELDHYASAVASLQHRKTALEKIVDLKYMGYASAEPRARPETGQSDGVKKERKRQARAAE